MALLCSNCGGQCSSDGTCPDCGQALTVGPQQGATKKCPYCAETIRAEAIKCRFCGEHLNTSKNPRQPALKEPSRRRIWLCLLLFVLYCLSYLVARRSYILVHEVESYYPTPQAISYSRRHTVRPSEPRAVYQLMSVFYTPPRYAEQLFWNIKYPLQ